MQRRILTQIDLLAPNDGRRASGQHETLHVVCICILQEFCNLFSFHLVSTLPLFISPSAPQSGPQPSAVFPGNNLCVGHFPALSAISGVNESVDNWSGVFCMRNIIRVKNKPIF